MRVRVCPPKGFTSVEGEIEVIVYSTCYTLKVDLTCGILPRVLRTMGLQDPAMAILGRMQVISVAEEAVMAQSWEAYSTEVTVGRSVP